MLCWLEKQRPICGRFALLAVVAAIGWVAYLPRNVWSAPSSRCSDTAHGLRRQGEHGSFAPSGTPHIPSEAGLWRGLDAVLSRPAWASV
jgi:hypothetical protein